MLQLCGFECACVSDTGGHSCLRSPIDMIDCVCFFGYFCCCCCMQAGTSVITCAFGDIWSDMTTEHKFPVEIRVEIPSFLLDHVSPLDTESAVAYYCAKIEDGSITQFAKSFCLEAKMLCHEGGDMMEIPYRPQQHEEVVDDHLISGEYSGQSGKEVTEEDMFHPLLTHSTSFSARDLAAGNDIHLAVDSIRDLFPTMSFLPQNVSKLLPFSRYLFTVINKLGLDQFLRRYCRPVRVLIADCGLQNSVKMPNYSAEKLKKQITAIAFIVEMHARIVQCFSVRNRNMIN